MNDYLLFVAGVAMAAITVFLMREMTKPPGLSRRQGRRHGGARGGFGGAVGEIFTPKVLVIEFDEMGPGLQVNGEYHNPFERVRVDLVAAEVSTGGGAMEMVCAEDEDENDLTGKYIGDLVNLASPTWLEEDQAGKFRAPMRDIEMEEKITDILGKVDDMAERMVHAMDTELGEYPLDEKSLEQYLDTFLSDYDVRALMDKLKEIFPWQEGHVTLTTWFTDPDDGILDEIPITFRLDEEDSQTLFGNLKIMVANSLLAEMGVDLFEYRKVVLEEVDEGEL